MKLYEIFDPLSLGENLIAAFGNRQINEYTINFLSLVVLRTHYSKVGEIKTSIGVMEVFKLNTSDYYIVGEKVSRGEHSKFAQVFKITLKKTKIPNHPETFHNVEGVIVPDSLRGQGIAAGVYRFLVKHEKINMLGDETQYFGARKLWASLSKHSDITIDIIDITTGNFLERDVVPHHGDEDFEFDERVWSYDVDKKHIRLILKDIQYK